MPDETPQVGGESSESPLSPPDASAIPGSADDLAGSADDAVDSAGDPFGGMDQASIDELLKQASFDDPTVASTAMKAELAEAATAVAELPETSAMELPNFQQVMRDAQVSSIDLLRDVDLNVKIELGRSRMLVEDVLKLTEGAVVELDKLAGDPVDVFVNDRLVARGEVLVLNDNFCVRINEIVAGIKEEGM